jgi:uncharacterized protein (TIGR04255 family)
LAKQRHLPNAPITEALIDFAVTSKPGLTFAQLKETAGSIVPGYYVKGPISLGTVAFQLTDDGKAPPASSASQQIGVRLHSQDEKYVAQFRLNGFTLSRLPPYEDWAKLEAETKRLWNIYLACFTPLRIIRVATRFINNLRLPLEAGTSFQRYVQKLIEVPDEAPQSVTGFFQRFQLVDTDSGSLVVLTLAMDSALPINQAPVILDVDCSVASDLSSKDPEVWNILASLRAIKNRTFFGTITERAAELYQ